MGGSGSEGGFGGLGIGNPGSYGGSSTVDSPGSDRGYHNSSSGRDDSDSRSSSNSGSTMSQREVEIPGVCTPGSRCSISDLYSETPQTTSTEEEEKVDEGNDDDVAENFIAQSDVNKMTGEVIKSTLTGLIEQQGKVPIPGDKTEMVMKNMKEISEALDVVNKGTKDGNFMREAFENLNNPGAINQEMIDRNFGRDTTGSLQDEIEETVEELWDE
jgi:hypothetical protein